MKPLRCMIWAWAVFLAVPLRMNSVRRGPCNSLGQVLVLSFVVFNFLVLNIILIRPRRLPHSRAG